MSSPTFKSTLSITHVGTATAILELDSINLLTDPFFSPAGTEFEIQGLTLKISDTPALKLEDLPVIDAVLLSHEDHPDNLDSYGRQLLDGRVVFTTMDGASKLAPRRGVRGFKPWESADVTIGGKPFRVTATPCQHVPGGECTGFVLTTPSFGETDGLPNAIYFTGDTVYIEELAKLRDMFHISVALMNLGDAHAPIADPPINITMDGKQAARLARDIKADIVVPIHFDSWGHFMQKGDQLRKAFDEEGLDNVIWLEPGVSTKVI